MAQNTAIEWASTVGPDGKIYQGHSFNIVWGCRRVSEGCVNCYAEAADYRWHGDNAHWGGKAPRKQMSEAYWKQPLKWNKDAQALGVRHKVFCSSMADVFEDHPDLEVPRLRLWETIFQTPWLDWLLLTKRPENILAMVPVKWQSGFPENVWMGTTAENQVRANERIPYLLQVPAAVHFLSCEPLLSSLDLTRIRTTAKQLFNGAPQVSDYFNCLGPDHSQFEHAVDWVICGGESGPKARSMPLDWARQLKDQCEAHGVAFFMKQLSQADTSRYKDFALFPADLQVRAFPPVAA